MNNIYKITKLKHRKVLRSFEQSFRDFRNARHFKEKIIHRQNDDKDNRCIIIHFLKIHVTNFIIKFYSNHFF